MVILEKAEKNYSAYVPDLPGCISTGKNVRETLKNIHEAIQCHIEMMEEMGYYVPKPNTHSAHIVEI